MPPIIYPALLSRVAYEFQRTMILTDHFKNGIEYKNSFTGQEAVVMIILGQCWLVILEIDRGKLYSTITYSLTTKLFPACCYI